MLTPFTELLIRDYFFSDHCLMGHHSEEIVQQWEVFVDGLKQFRELAEDHVCHDYSAMKEEEQWILPDESEWPFSFVHLCKTFGMNPHSVRDALFVCKSHQGATESQAGRKKTPLRPFLQA